MTDLDQLFKEKSQQISIQPTADAWKTLDKKLGRRKLRKPKRGFLRANSIIITCIIIGLLALCVLYVFMHRTQ